MSDPVVRVKEGDLQGTTGKCRSGRTYYSFLGIPFAEPPVDNLRFKDPVPKKPWNGIRDATKEGGICAQMDMFTYEFSGDEDCLYLNVHTPHLKKDGPPLPVIVNFHGGGFLNGSGSKDKFGPEYLMEEDVILVTTNYRLGVLGFLCTDPVNARGDMGLVDQQLSLIWVKENIGAFNGDVNNITIFGISAGAASVEYHMLAEKSRECFHKAILNSGSTLNPWSRISDPIGNAMKLAKILMYPSEDTDGLFEFLNKIDIRDLIKATVKMLTFDLTQEGVLYPFGPAINVFNDGKGFLTKEPIDMLKSGDFHKVPTINGLCEYEGMFMKIFYRSTECQEIFKNRDYLKLVPSNFNKKLEGCEDKMKVFYTPSADDKNPDDFVMNFLSDLSFNAGVLKSLEYRMKHNPLDHYFYLFRYDGNMNMLKSIAKFPDVGACHGDDYTYLGPHCLVPTTNATDKDWTVKDRMVKMWTNFARHGNPTPVKSELIKNIWMPTATGDFKYLDISDELSMRTELWTERMNLWNEMY